MSEAPRIMFVPVSGPSGAGEYYEALAVAAGVRCAWPAAEIRFVINREARYARQVPYPCTLIDASPTRATGSVIDAMNAHRPQVVVFISSGRVGQYRAARRLGAQVVYMSQRPNSRWKGFRLRRMRYFDQHWISQSRMQGAALNWLERLKLRLMPHLEMVFFDGLHEPVDAAAVRRRREMLGLEPGRYLVFCPGGGGKFGGLSAPEIFIEAAREVGTRSRYKVLVVTGPNSTASADDGQLALVHSLPNGELMGLLRDARLAVTNGGTLVVQTIMQGTPCVAVPIAGDQEQRIAPYARLGMAVRARLEPRAMVGATMRLLDDESALQAMRSAIDRMPLENGIDVARRALARLLASASDPAAGPVPSFARGCGADSRTLRGNDASLDGDSP